MGVFVVDVGVARPGRRPRCATFRRVLVDTGAEMTWLPEAELRSAGVETFKRDQLFVTANGQYVTRHVGVAIIECGKLETVDEVVFAQPDCRPVGIGPGMAAPIGHASFHGSFVSAPQAFIGA